MHFFPSSVGVAGPYGAQCKLTLFGKDVEKKSVTLEGARFGQPDGFRLDDVFPQLQEGVNGFFGLEFEITSTQPRTDLSASACVLELSSRGQSCRFWPRRFVQDLEPPPRGSPVPRTAPARPMAALKDAFTTSSLVIVNGTPEAFDPAFLVAGSTTSESGELTRLEIEPLAAHSVVEIDVSDTATGTFDALQCSWGLVRSGGIWLQNPLPDNVIAYAMYRDVTTRRPVSVTYL